MTKAIMSAVVGGAMVFVGTAATDAAHKNAIPANLRAHFEKFWAEVHKNTPREMANRQPAPVDNVVSTSSRTESAPKRALIRLAAAGSDMDFQSPEMTAAVRPLIPAKPDCVLPISTSTEPPALRAKHFEIGDKLKLAFFENVEDVEGTSGATPLVQGSNSTRNSPVITRSRRMGRSRSPYSACSKSLT